MGKYFLFVLLVILVVPVAYTQHNTTMVDSITTNSAGGKVEIYQDPGITNLLGKINTSDAPLKNKKVTNRKGFRIQAYSGSQQTVAKTEVYEREKRFRGRFPEYATYVTYNSPFWKLRVGDFADQYDAEEALRAIKNAFPQYSNELYIVSDNVRISE
ncbi:MAG: SPOR domain-containing protein [Candidatus Azobacteroides sp.]|nr:SPOR domain-containing protein [Candidatus Azobacteroides sp.]